MKAIIYVGLDGKKRLIVCDDYKADYEDKHIYFLKDSERFCVRFLSVVIKTENYDDEQKIVFEEFLRGN